MALRADKQQQIRKTAAGKAREDSQKEHDRGGPKDDRFVGDKQDGAVFVGEDGSIWILPWADDGKPRLIGMVPAGTVPALADVPSTPPLEGRRAS